MMTARRVSMNRAMSGQFTPRKLDVLDFIEWVWNLQWRERLRTDPSVQWNEDEAREMECMLPGDTQAPSYLDTALPEYRGLLDVQLYWPCVLPRGTIAEPPES